jgi:hypothetical protein
MSILSRFARKAEEQAVLPDLPTECGHWEMAPRWDSAADMGKKDKVTYLTCTNCKETFTPEEAERFVLTASA